MPSIGSDSTARFSNLDNHRREDDAPSEVTRRGAASPAASASGAAARGAAASASSSTSSAARAFERIATSTDYAAFVANVGAASASRDAQVQAKLDALRDRFSGPYTVMGEAVTARPMFRMNYERPKEMTAAVEKAARRVGVNPNPIIWGQGTPAQLVKVTQALIDMGRLPEGPGDLGARIRKMQWDHGIGVDCAGYCKEALLATSPKVLPLERPGMESFRDLDGKRAHAFVKVSVEDARPGDLVTLDPLPPEKYGHNVMVYSRAVADDARRSALATAHGPSMAAFLASPGPHHVIEVDSSWGAGGVGADHGGYRRDTWIYDASSKTWGWFEPAEPRAFVTAKAGPSNDKHHGVYRPR